jgi:hypothetical protein
METGCFVVVGGFALVVEMAKSAWCEDCAVAADVELRVWIVSSEVGGDAAAAAVAWKSNYCSKWHCDTVGLVVPVPC